jgi:hypothetical protein
MKHGMRIAAWTTAGVVGAGAVVGVAQAATSGNGSGSGAPSLSAVQAALTGDASGTAGTPSTGRAALRQKALRQLTRKLAAGAVHGQVTVDTKNGVQTIDFQRGTVSGATSTAFTVTDSTGTTENWAVTSTTKVRAHKGDTAASAQITDGETVVVIGLDDGGAQSARLVMVLPPKPAAAPSGGATTPSAGPTTPSAALQG